MDWPEPDSDEWLFCLVVTTISDICSPSGLVDTDNGETASQTLDDQ